MNYPYQKAEIASDDFQIIEDLATGAWYSEVLFTAMELGIFDALSAGPYSLEDLSVRLKYDDDGLGRFMATLAVFGLVLEVDGRFENGPLASRFLVRGGECFAGDFIGYRRFLATHWKRLGSRIRDGVRANDRSAEESREAYEERVLAYVRAMDFQARIKAEDAVNHLALLSDVEPHRILDFGGGAGAWCRALHAKWPNARAVLLDLPETLDAARKLYPDASSWEGIQAIPSNGLDPCIGAQVFDIIILSNILHAYGPVEAKQLLADAVRFLAPGGLLIIHDYLADGHRSSPLKGRLYDLHMMLNTYNGRIYTLKELQDMLDCAGLRNSRLLDLGTDTSILMSRKHDRIGHSSITGEEMIEAHARALGFGFARTIKAEEIVLEPWVKLKCEFGCSRYGTSLTCPPHTPGKDEIREVFSRYSHALLIQATPPSIQFHDRLLALERFFYLNGHSEALAFGAGPCAVCPSCPTDGQCLNPEKARPSLEACGVDVYETARRVGLSLEPVRSRSGYVKYVGLVLFNEKRNHAYSVDPGSFNAGL